MAGRLAVRSASDTQRQVHLRPRRSQQLQRCLLSSTAQGTAYEEHCMAYLTKYLPRTIRQLVRTGGAGDRGIDLTGRLHPGGQLLVVQCKSIHKPVGPSALRELEGSLGFHRDADPLGVLFGASGFAPSTCQRCATCELPLVLMHLAAPHDPGANPSLPTRPYWLRGMLLSPSAQTLLGAAMELRKGIDAGGNSFVSVHELT